MVSSKNSRDVPIHTPLSQQQDSAQDGGIKIGQHHWRKLMFLLIGVWGGNVVCQFLIGIEDLTQQLTCFSLVRVWKIGWNRFFTFHVGPCSLLVASGHRTYSESPKGPGPSWWPVSRHCRLCCFSGCPWAGAWPWLWCVFTILRILLSALHLLPRFQPAGIR